jgi:hypothetical protein
MELDIDIIDIDLANRCSANKQYSELFAGCTPFPIIMKFSIFWIIALGASLADALPSNEAPSDLPKKVIADVEVVYTPIIADAIEYARANSDNVTFNHVMRSFLFGSIQLSANASLSKVDKEVLALGTILHDLGLDNTPGSRLISPIWRFEVDGAIAARNFIRSHPDGKKWDEKRVQLVWDGIALHTEHQIAYNKELDVQAISLGVMHDFMGPGGVLKQDAYLKILAEYPMYDLFQAIKQRAIWLCKTKPAATYGEQTVRF